MTELSRGGGRWGVAATLLALGMSVAAGTARGQEPPPASGRTPVPTEPSAPAATPVPIPTGTHVTKEQAKELFRSVDEILQFASTDSKLPIEHTVKRKLISRDQVTRFLRQKFDEDESTKRMERSELVLKKFGLLDRDFHLRPFLVSLLTEQIAGFYDDKTKTVNLLDWIEPEEQKPVLAHELTHALQDQRVDLSKWSDVEAKGVAKDMREDNRHLQFDEGDTAREAVTEGQAMVVYVDYSLRSTGKTLADAPDLADKLKDMTSDTAGSPVLARAPLLLQQSLLFPYGDGLSFEQSVLIKGGREAAFAGVLAHPPSSSFEIIHPDAYLAHTPVPVLRLPDIHPLLDPEYTPYDIGVMGELDARILLELFGGRQIASALSPMWKGGIYYAAQRKSATAAEKQSSASLGLIYYSRWANPDSARSFLRVYTDQLPRKYSGLVRRNQEEADDREQVYSTNEGDVLIAIYGTGVFIAEGFALPLARKLEDSIVAAQSKGPIQIASSPAPKQEPGELTLALARYLSSFGMVKAGMLNEAGRYTLDRR
ncbi:MAG TPA: hypothetical protein VNW54_03220 [Granulicella sp.]|jgi:hypothetical protein|nr:hypothetical protein [Granulicella sp.]